MSDSKGQTRVLIWLMGVTIFFVVGATTISLTTIYQSYVTDALRDSEKADLLEAIGQRGDSFGSWNAFFSGGALAAVIFTLMMQYRQLKEQKESSELQQFESSFFNLLSLHNEIPKEMQIGYKTHEIFATHEFSIGVKAEGYSCFGLFENVLEAIREEDPRATIRMQYQSLYSEFEAELGHYFRMLYTLVRFIDDSSMNCKNIENLMVVPEKTDIVLQLESRDVIHSFFVADLRLKQDIVPGMLQFAWFNASRTGDLEILCTELCGWGHYKMNAKLRIVSQPEYEQWLAELQSEYYP